MSELLDRRQAVAALLEERGPLLVVSGLGSPSYDLFAAGDHPANFYLWGAMGSAALVGLGLALAQPGRPVLALTGDGEQLMGLGGLATIGIAAAPNLNVVVIDNGCYGETGMQTSHTGFGLKLHQVAAACGFAQAVELTDLAALEHFRPALHWATGGPRFAAIKVAPNNPPRSLPPRDGVFLKHRFRDHLGFPVK